MRITFEPTQDNNIQSRGAAERPHASMRDTAERAEKAGAYSVNIGGRDRRVQGGTYKKENMTAEKFSAEEISMQAGQMDMDVQKMYMAVMSNSMSEEEFNKMLEDDYNVSDTDIETMVTILDQIKVAVAKGGTDIPGYTDNLSKETLEQILGSSAYAEALESGLEESAAAYMVEQQMPPTAENIYKAKYSAGAYQEAQEREVPDRESAEGNAFWDQVDRVIKDAGLPQDEERRADAAFLLKHDVPLTEENLQLYEKIKDFKKDGEKISEEEIKHRIAMQAYEGKAASQADLSKTESIYEQAVNLYEEVQKLTPEAAVEAIRNHSEGRNLTLKDIIESGRESDKAVKEKKAEKEPDAKDIMPDNAETGKAVQAPKESKELLTARRQLEEVRLRMTIEVNIKLLRSNFQIDTVPMEQLIERLKEAESMLETQGIPQAAEAAGKLNDLRTMPMAALGYVVNREISFTIEALHEKGSELQEQVKKEAARERYETMQTQVRPDLGDSIRKAFRNVDDILTDMNKEPSEENRRAVRMLGYNRLEISEENLTRALEVDGKIQNLFRDMKPGKVLQMIRDGVDVLHTDIEELDEYLTRQRSSFMEESEDFARFLYKLDKNGGITAEERENYIGIYRLVRQVEKSDGRAQGYLLGSEAELTMENLLSAVRSGKRGSMDYKIDENFSGVDAMQRGKNIVDQINAAPYENAKGFEDTMQALEGADRKTKQAGEEAADFLKDVKEPVTVSNLLEASSVLQEDAGLYRKLEDYDKETDREESEEEKQSRLESYVLELHEAVTDEDSLQEGMEAFANQAEEILRTAGEQDGVTELDIRDMQNLYKGIRFRCAISRESRFQIPIKLEAGYTVMNLTVRRGTDAAQAEISMETEEYGRLEALFVESEEEQAVRDGAGGSILTESREEKTAEISKISITGNFFAETAEGVKLLQGIAEKVQGRLENVGISANNMTVMRGSRVKQGLTNALTGGAEEKDSSGKTRQKEISTGELYQIAKIFLETVRNEW